MSISDNRFEAYKMAAEACRKQDPAPKDGTYTFRADAAASGLLSETVLKWLLEHREVTARATIPFFNEKGELVKMVIVV